MSSFFAFLHHVAAFALVAALVVEFVLIRDELSATTVRRLARADMPPSSPSSRCSRWSRLSRSTRR